MNLEKISTTELRHFNISELAHIANELAHIIDNNNNWIKILEAIPKDLNNISENHLDGQYERKYKSIDANIIRTAAQRQQISPSFILLFEEWGTSGRHRPTIQHLYELLISLPLFRAADYIADQILHIPRPHRPNIGPGKKIDITLPKPEIDSNLIDILEAFHFPNTMSIEDPEFDTSHDNQESRNQYTESSPKLCSSSESIDVAETDEETSEDNYNSSYTDKVPHDIEPCYQRVDNGQVNIPKLSLLKCV